MRYQIFCCWWVICNSLLPIGADRPQMTTLELVHGGFQMKTGKKGGIKRTKDGFQRRRQSISLVQNDMEVQEHGNETRLVSVAPDQPTVKGEGCANSWFTYCKKRQEKEDCSC